jgi:signal transduction histidine kinase
LVTARARIVGWMLLLVAVALAGSVAATWEALSARADGLADSEMTHEANKFQTYARSADARRFGRVDALLQSWVEDNLPDSYETFFSVVDGRPGVRSRRDPPARLDTDPAFLAKVAAAGGPTYGWVDTPAGKARYGVLPVRVQGDSRQGRFVMVEFRDQLARPLNDALQVFASVSVLALLVAGGVSWLIAGRVLAPIRLVRQTADQITETDLRRRIPESGRDDVARLAQTFNRMLDRLEEAFAGQRRFLDDAGHELRTPLTVIRGHLELMEVDDQADREATKALVIDELGRMNRIVEDLLILAKAQRPDFLTLEEVILADLTVDSVAKARLLAASRRWAVAAVADAVILADGQRLTQALMQLAANAVQHTADGDRIAIGSAVRDGRVLLWVQDSGEGIAPADQERIFDRFTRGNAADRTEGAGLGLAIVASIAAAHGGSVRVDSLLGAGATFTLDLPARLIHAGGADGEPDEALDDDLDATLPAGLAQQPAGNGYRGRPPDAATQPAPGSDQSQRR